MKAEWAKIYPLSFGKVATLCLLAISFLWEKKDLFCFKDEVSHHKTTLSTGGAGTAHRLSL